MGRLSPERVPVETVKHVLGLYRKKYYDCNVQHFYEKLQAVHGVPLERRFAAGLRKWNPFRFPCEGSTGTN